jgi:malate synthase
MKNYINIGDLKVSPTLYNFINLEALPGSDVTIKEFWCGLEYLVNEFGPRNKVLLDKRAELQRKISEWHKENKDTFVFEKYKRFLESIGYLEKKVDDFEITTKSVDDEIAYQAGPQLVVPVNNSRYALNAANARWGSLYDALYGTNVINDIDGAQIGEGYNPVRGQKVIRYAKEFLDQVVPLVDFSHEEVADYSIVDGKLSVKKHTGRKTKLKDEFKFVGYQGQPEEPSAILFRNNGIHFEVQIDRNHPIGQSDSAGVKDIIMEAALSTIMDFEDSVAAVDSEDKVDVYRNWLGLIKGNLSASFKKGERFVTRNLNPDRIYNSTLGANFTLRGRSLMLVRNVGHLMTTNAVLVKDYQEIPEGILDGIISSLIAKHDLLNNGKFKNSDKGSIYIVKPKMHGSEEVAFANELFDKIEDILGLERNTLKIGVMDEERRTSLNLKACIHKVKDRVVFINTGFLDRTGDEIHTSMEAGPVVRKNEIKTSTWIKAYEHSNVLTGLKCGFQGHAQIGKGMWAMPDLMKEMLMQKIDHLKAGASTAWVPSPTAAVLHAIHYHQVSVTDVQNQLVSESQDLTDAILDFQLAKNPIWSSEEIQQELDNNTQSVLGYVVRWIDQGIGCSKVPDINNVGLMEDRATLRISSQHIANWLQHGICTKQQVLATLKRIAKLVDEQNVDDIGYRPMSHNYDKSVAFQAACELIFKGAEQPNGYTEPILHRRRLQVKEDSLSEQIK